MAHLPGARLHSVRLASTRLGWLLAFLFAALYCTRLGTQDKLMPQGQSRGRARDVRRFTERKDLYPLRIYTYVYVYAHQQQNTLFDISDGIHGSIHKS